MTKRNNKLLFFTQKEKWKQNYILYRIKKKTTFDLIKELSEKYKEILIDPGVYDLKKSNEYSNIILLHQIAQSKLPRNVFISIDYPCDMNLEYTDEFIRKSNENNFKYRENNQYICCIQFKFSNFEDFIKNWNLLKPIWKNNPKKMIAIGNLCRLVDKKNQFVNKVFNFIIQEKIINRIHFYGLGKHAIKQYIPNLLKMGFNISIDSTKWTRASNDKCRESVMKEKGLEFFKGCKGYNGCTTKIREIFFTEYINDLRKTINVEY